MTTQPTPTELQEFQRFVADNLLARFFPPGKKSLVKFKENGGVSRQKLTYRHIEIDEQGNAWVIFEELVIPVHHIIEVH